MACSVLFKSRIRPSHGSSFSGGVRSGAVLMELAAAVGVGMAAPERRDLSQSTRTLCVLEPASLAAGTNTS